MNKKLIAVALAALPVVSMADVTVYGSLKGGWEGDKVTNNTTQARVDDYTSYIGFKGNEDLGNGLKGIWQIESRFHVDGAGRDGPFDDSNTIGSRETFVGLEGAFGKVRLGRINNALQDLSQVDPWVYAGNGMSYVNSNNIATRSHGANGLIAYSVNMYHLPNSLRYDTPDLMGFTAHVEYGFGENGRSGVRSSDVASLGLNYANSGFFGHYAYQQEFNPLGVNLVTGAFSAQPDGTRKTANINRLELGYDANNLLVALGYQRARGYDWGDVLSGDAGFSGSLPYFNNAILPTPAQRQLISKQAALTIGYTFGAFTPRVSYAKGWNQSDNLFGSISNSGYTQYVLGVDYQLSKRTQTGISYGNLKWGANTTQSLQQYNTGAVNPGSTTIQTWGVHLTHNF